MTSDHFTAHLSLLKIRQSAYRRNMILAGGLFLMAILLTVGQGLVTGWDQRGGYLMAGFDVLFTVGFLMAWVRLEIVKGEIELMNNLQVRDR